MLLLTYSTLFVFFCFHLFLFQQLNKGSIKPVYFYIELLKKKKRFQIRQKQYKVSKRINRIGFSIKI